MKLFSHPELLAEPDDTAPEPASTGVGTRIRDRFNVGRHALWGAVRMPGGASGPGDEQPAAVEVDPDEPVVARRRPARFGYVMGVLLVVGVAGVASSPIPTVQDLGRAAGAEPAEAVVPPDLLTAPAAEPAIDPGVGVTIPVAPTEPVAPTSASPRPPVVLEIPLPTPAEISAVTTPTTGADSTAATDPIGSLTPTDPSRRRSPVHRPTRPAP